MNYRNEDPSQNKYHIPYLPPAGADFGEPIRTRQLSEWDRHKQHYCKKLFTPRLQRDLQQIEPPAFPDVNFWDGEGFFSFGPAGTGKTVYAAQMLLDVQKHLWLNFQTKSVRFTSVPKLFGRLKKSFNTEDSDQYRILDEQNDTWLLVLDDLGVSGKPSDWLLETLYSIINYRYENLLPTVITSNLDLSGLSELYGDVRITSRIDRMCKTAKKRHWNTQ